MHHWGVGGGRGGEGGWLHGFWVRVVVAVPTRISLDCRWIELRSLEGVQFLRGKALCGVECRVSDEVLE